MREFPKDGEALFLESVKSKYAEFESLFAKGCQGERARTYKLDLLQFLMEHSEFLNREENKWMLMVIEVIRTHLALFSTTDQNQDSQ